jgi:DUF1680 family protein
VITIKEATTNLVNIFLRIPGWSKGYSLSINGFYPKVRDTDKGFVVAARKWNAGDKIELNFSMPATLIESNPLVEETRNQVAIKRGPLVYCLESADLPNNNIFNVVIPSAIKFKEMPMKIEGSQLIALYGDAKISKQTNWKNSLYRELNNNLQPIKIKLIPYYAWANRGKTDMTVWMNLQR